MKIRFLRRQEHLVAPLALLGALIFFVNPNCAQPIQPEILFSFTNGPVNPNAALAQGPDGSFYGTTVYGGDLSLNDGYGGGTIFRLSTNGVLTTLVSFNGTNGAHPQTALTLGPDGNFYGTTSEGGAANGTVFRVTTNGVLTTLVSFDYTNGAYPSGLALGRDGNFYGTTVYGGDWSAYHGYGGGGTIFRLATNGVLTTLASFNGTNGAHPQATLALGPDGNFYGTTKEGGITNSSNSSGFGAVFRVTTNGVLTSLALFGGTNGDGPEADLALGSDGNLYGTTSYSANGYGTVFQVTTSGVITTLVSFVGTNGANPYAGLTLGSDGNFYGTTPYGGSFGYGTVFEITTNGVLTTLLSFDATDGAEPYAGLTLGSDGSFYGTTEYGGTASAGTVFRLATNGVVTTLVSFGGANGYGPEAALAPGNDGNFYGTTWGGGGNGVGTVFRLTSNGALTTLYSFGAIWDMNGALDGANPYAGLTLGNDGNFYGTTLAGGGFLDCGTVFRLTTNGVLTTLYQFGAISDMNGNAYDGSDPSGLALGSDGNFYGTTSGGGDNGVGTVFRVTTNGALTTLYSFFVSALDGEIPEAALTLGSDGNFYGTTRDGGSSGDGTVFRVTTNGVVTTLVSFSGTNGSGPQAALNLGADGNLYGTTWGGGSNGYGTVFKVTTNGALTTLASFKGTNGTYPYAALNLGSDGNFYGTTAHGGNDWNGTNIYSGYGTVFQVATNGVLTTLVSFKGTNGANPLAALALGSDGNLYGTTANGGSGGGGVIFRLRRGVTIQSFGMATNGFQLNTLNVGGSGWVVLESSSDLMQWTPIQTNGTAAAQQFLDPTALTRPWQFYRVRQQ